MTDNKKNSFDDLFDPFEGQQKENEEREPLFDDVFSPFEDEKKSVENFASLEDDILFSNIYEDKAENHSKIEKKKERKEKSKKQTLHEKLNPKPKFHQIILGGFFNLLTWMISAATFAAISLMLVGTSFYQRVKTEVMLQDDPIGKLQARHYISTSKIYGDGRLLNEIGSEKRFYLPLNRIPDEIQDAFIATEDSRFYDHFGADPIGIIKTLLEAVLAGRERGASTITQQMIKNEVYFEIDPATGEKLTKSTLNRKLREIVAAVEVEKALSKQQILEQYLNGILLGRYKTYGVAEAARYYFDKELTELTLPESAYLAGIPKAPSRYDIWRNPQLGESRKRIVIARMLDEGYITEAQANEARETPLETRRGTHQDEKETEYGAYFAATVNESLERIAKSQGFNQDGLTVYTTIDSDMQKYAYEALRKHLIDYDRRRGWRGATQNISLTDENGRQVNWIEKLAMTNLPSIGNWRKAVVVSLNDTQVVLGFVDGSKGIIDKEGMSWNRQSINKSFKIGDVIAVSPIEGNRYMLEQVPLVSGALIAMEPNTGKILALQGGFGFDVNGAAYNRAVSALRQPGSSFKPFVYLAAMENEFTPASNVIDEPIRYGSWEPKNYGGDFLGQMTLRKALCLSRNIPAVKLGENTGMAKVADMVKRLGVITNPEHLTSVSQQLSATLGSQEVTPLRMALGFSQIVNGGYQITPTVIDRIQNASGEMVYRHDDRHCSTCKQDEYDGQDMPYIADSRTQVIDPIAAFQVVQMLNCVTQNGTASSVYRNLQRPVAGKTGTTNDEKDAWFVGFTPDLVVAVYIGYDQPQRLGRGATGGKLAAPVFIDFMSEALKNKPKTPFRQAEGATMMYMDDMGWPTYTRSGHLTAFKPGTEPVAGPNMVGNGSAVYIQNTDGGNKNTGNVTRATGGLW